jgi:hypothetical protein
VTCRLMSCFGAMLKVPAWAIISESKMCFIKIFLSLNVFLLNQNRSFILFTEKEVKFLKVHMLNFSWSN